MAKPLQAVFLLAARAVGSLKASKMARYQVNFTDAQSEAFEKIKSTLNNLPKMAHVDYDKLVCYFCDASDTGWGGVLTQLPLEDLDSPFD